MPALPPEIEPIPSSEYMIDRDGGGYESEQNTIRKRRLFLAAAALLALIMAAVAIAHRAQAGAFRTIDVPDYVWDVCRGDENDADILCYRAGEEYACSCACYGFAWAEGRDPAITERTCGDDDVDY
ncbi:hypothetical protein ACHAXT_010948 [Thalassiosira profunda]